MWRGSASGKASGSHWLEASPQGFSAELGTWKPSSRAAGREEELLGEGLCSEELLGGGLRAGGCQGGKPPS